jgi:uncharacterized DUF497 family protein
MYVRLLHWDETNVEHIARHGLDPEEVEEVCLDQTTLFTRAGRRRYQAIGQTAAGRYLTVFLDHLGAGRYYPVTARPSTERERRLWRRHMRR